MLQMASTPDTGPCALLSGWPTAERVARRCRLTCHCDPISRLGHIHHCIKAEHGDRVWRLSLRNVVGILLQKGACAPFKLVMASGARAGSSSRQRVKPPGAQVTVSAGPGTVLMSAGMATQQHQSMFSHQPA